MDRDEPTLRTSENHDSQITGDPEPALTDEPGLSSEAHQYGDETEGLPRWSPMHRGAWYVRRRGKVYDHYILRRSREADFRRRSAARSS